MPLTPSLNRFRNTSEVNWPCSRFLVYIEKPTTILKICNSDRTQWLKLAWNPKFMGYLKIGKKKPHFCQANFGPGFHWKLPILVEWGQFRQKKKRKQEIFICDLLFNFDYRVHSFHARNLLRAPRKHLVNIT